MDITHPDPQMVARTTTGWGKTQTSGTPGLSHPYLSAWCLGEPFHGGVLGGLPLDLPHVWLSFTCIIVTITLACLGRGDRVPGRPQRR